MGGALAEWTATGEHESARGSPGRSCMGTGAHNWYLLGLGVSHAVLAGLVELLRVQSKARRGIQGMHDHEGELGPREFPSRLAREDGLGVLVQSTGGEAVMLTYPVPSIWHCVLVPVDMRPQRQPPIDCENHRLSLVASNGLFEKHVQLLIAEGAVMGQIPLEVNFRFQLFIVQLFRVLGTYEDPVQRERSGWFLAPGHCRTTYQGGPLNTGSCTSTSLCVRSHCLSKN